MDADQLEELLVQTKYDKRKTKILIDGFKNGFTLGYQGKEDVKIKSPNLKFQEGVGDEIELWNKVMKEVGEKRYAGPYKEIPFEDGYIQSPIGLVPKDNGASTRLIFHLSYPRIGKRGVANGSEEYQDGEKIAGRKTVNMEPTSVNGNTPRDICSVKYPDVSKAIRLCLKEGRNCFCSKSDWKSAFRHFPIQKRFWKFLVMKARNPKDHQWYYFIDKCMPFGSSISCAHFQSFSNAIAHIMRVKTGKDNVNYLDDFLFIALLAYICNGQTKLFLEICQEIRFPVSMEKTCWAMTVITFLGMLLDTEKQILSIPTEKILKALNQIDSILKSKKRKATVLQVQQLCGILNFLCRAVVPGRPFLRRLYSSLVGYTSALKPHHHVKLARDIILDLQMWKVFLETPEAFCRPFIDFDNHLSATELDWYTDSAKAIGKGYGGHHEVSYYGLRNTKTTG